MEEDKLKLEEEEEGRMWINREALEDEWRERNEWRKVLKENTYK